MPLDLAAELGVTTASLSQAIRVATIGEIDQNAAKFSPEHMPIEVLLRSEGGNAIFEVADHGKGIPPEELPTLFTGTRAHTEPSADSSRGMGIGLSICNTIVAAHGGKISAENRPQGGAVFRFTLPLGA